jgi:hypothetical protein
MNDDDSSMASLYRRMLNALMMRGPSDCKLLLTSKLMTRQVQITIATAASPHKLLILDGSCTAHQY